MFQFASCPAKRYIQPCGHIFTFGCLAERDRLLDSETAGSKVYGTYPTSIAAICVLPRPKSPRHSLSTSWVDYLKIFSTSLHLSRSQNAPHFGDADPCIPQSGIAGSRSPAKRDPLTHLVVGLWSLGGELPHRKTKDQLPNLSLPWAKPKGGPEGSRTPYLFIANEVFNRVNFGPAPHYIH